VSLLVASGATSGATFASPVGMANTPTQLTLAVWYRPVDLASTNAIIARHNGTTIGCQIRQRASGNFQVTLARSAGAQAGVTATTDAPLKLNEWICVAGTIDTTAASGAAYSGTLNAPMTARAGAYSNATAPTGSLSGLPVKLCNRGPAGTDSDGCPGEIAFAAYWERVLTLKELQDWQADPRNAQRFGMKFLAAPGDRGDTLVDLIGLGVGSLVGAAALVSTPGALDRRPPRARRLGR
jgi:hypothetical protein